MTVNDDSFFAGIGKAMTVFALCVVAVLVAYALQTLYQADQSFLHDDTPLLAPDQVKARGGVFDRDSGVLSKRKP